MSKGGNGTCKEREITCLYCNKKFVSNKPSAKYCSVKCRNKWWNDSAPRKNIIENCVICNKLFIKKCRSKITCSKECSRNLRRINKRIEEQRLKNTNPLYKITTLLRSRIYHALKGKRKVVKTMVLLGCTISEFKQHLQQTAIKNGYLDFDINNYDGSEYHIDHIIPCASFNLLDEEEQRKCFHYTNLQILTAQENLIKKNKTIKICG